VGWRKETTGPSTALRSGRDEQKIKPIESISIFSVHFTLNLPQASRLLGMTILSRDRFSSFNKVVIPAEAYPDFLLRGTKDGRVCGFL
jgi:hypothetical protein